MGAMELSPHAVSAASFKTVKKGYDPDEVRSFLVQVSGTLESSQQQATAMEARARAAIAKLQEMANSHPPAAEPASPASSAAGLVVAPEEAETISRTLLLAQRTADLTVAEARNESESIRTFAEAEAAAVLEQAQAVAARLLDEARSEARRTKDEEVQRAENEVQALLARRDFLLGDVEHLERHVGAQRERLREASVALLDLVERVPGGLGEMRRPLLSASGQEPDESASSSAVPADMVESDVGQQEAEYESATDDDTADFDGIDDSAADDADDADEREPVGVAPIDPTPISGVLPFALGDMRGDDSR